jgi:Ca2+-binding EF-hand superfamily protein
LWYWRVFAGREGMDWDTFYAAFTLENKEASKEEVKGAFDNLDADKNGIINWRELQRVFHPKDIEDVQQKLRWYWNSFTADTKRGMTMEEFVAAGKLENAPGSVDDMKKQFISFDCNRSGSLEEKEFFNIPNGGCQGKFTNGGGKDEEREDPPPEHQVNARFDWYWRRFVSNNDRGMTFDEFV